jgi:hypothetical protein
VGAAAPAARAVTAISPTAGPAHFHPPEPPRSRSRPGRTADIGYFGKSSMAPLGPPAIGQTRSVEISDAGDGHSDSAGTTLQCPVGQAERAAMLGSSAGAALCGWWWSGEGEDSALDRLGNRPSGDVGNRRRPCRISATGGVVGTEWTDMGLCQRFRSAGINRHGGGDGRALRRRGSDPRRPRVMRRRLRGRRRSVDRGTCRPGYRATKCALRGAHAVGMAEGNTGGGDIARRRRTPRGQRTRACTEPPCARTGRSRTCPHR